MDIKIGSCSIGVILTIVFLVLQLCGVICWPWIYIFAPLLIELALIVFILLVFVIMWIITVIFS